METIGKKVIIRAKDAGVFYGTLTRKEGTEVDLANCRRIWYWDGAATLSQLATEGVSKPKNCKFSVVVESITILNICEIIPCTEKAQNNIESVAVWRV